jgi:hypothetical protein
MAYDFLEQSRVESGANIGAYPAGEEPFGSVVPRMPMGRPNYNSPAVWRQGIRTPGCWIPGAFRHYSWDDQGKEMVRTTSALNNCGAVKLTATLTRDASNINCDYPRDKQGNWLTKNYPTTFSRATTVCLVISTFSQRRVSIPRPAFNWDYVVQSARNLLRGGFSERPVDQPRTSASLQSNRP